jgi:hypothetical protein
MPVRDKKVHYAQADWNRFDHHSRSVAVAGDGTERSVIVSFLTIILFHSITQHIIKTENHFDAITEVVCSEEIDCCQTEQ